MDLRQWISERFAPVVMVFATPEAEEMVQVNNGLTVVEMLRPHGAFRNLSGASCCVCDLLLLELMTGSLSLSAVQNRSQLSSW